MNALEQDGVCLRKRALDPVELAAVIDEYQGSIPDFAEPVKHQPIVGFWNFIEGDKKKFRLLSDMPFLKALTEQIAKFLFSGARLRLLETIIFNKPPKRAGFLHWHQDVSYFPLEPNNQLAVWIPFDVVTTNSGAMMYALGSHLGGMRGSANLLTNVPITGENRKPLPLNPEDEGYEIACFEMFPGDMLVHDGRTWHASGPNTSTRERRGLSFRYIIGETRYRKRGGSAGPFTKQTDLQDGDMVDDPAFPVVA